VLDERDRFWYRLTSPLWWLWHLSGLRAIFARIHPSWKAASNPPPSTFLLWIVGIYAALFGIAAQRYENYIDRIEARANGIYAQLGATNWKQALARIPRAQAMTRPKEPDLFKPWSVACSLYFCDQERDAEMVEALKEVIVTFKHDLEHVHLHEVDLRKAGLVRANLRGANLDNASLCDADLHWGILIEANLHGADLVNAVLPGVDLREAQLGKADLRRTILVGADLRGANLHEADLRGAFLHDAKLSGAILQEVDLAGAILRRANLDNASLYGANLSQADLRLANLAGVKHATLEQLAAACVDETTQLPEGLHLPELPTQACEHWRR
jgi:uncharacterized protein YjbI with pentapeptide repeats